MSERDWRTEGVRVVRASALAAERATPGGGGRATVFDLLGTGGRETWIGTVSLPPLAKSGAHHHGRHEVVLYVVQGESRIRWGDNLEFYADVGPGDFVYFAPFVPHQEINASGENTLELLVVRSDRERIAVGLPASPVAAPEQVY